MTAMELIPSTGRSFDIILSSCSGRGQQVTSIFLLLPHPWFRFFCEAVSQRSNGVIFCVLNFLKFLFKGTRNDLGNLMSLGNVIHMNDQIKNETQFIRTA